MTDPLPSIPTVPLSWGEVIDKITILEIKVARLTDEQAQANAAKELSLLRAVVAYFALKPSSGGEGGNNRRERRDRGERGDATSPRSARQRHLRLDHRRRGGNGGCVQECGTHHAARVGQQPADRGRDRAACCSGNGCDR